MASADLDSGIRRSTGRFEVPGPAGPVSGRLKAGLLDLAETLQMLSASRRSGNLYVTLKDGATVTAHVDNGLIKAVKNSTGKNSIANALYKLGLIESSVYEGMTLDSGKSLTESWLERKVITEKDLLKAARYIASEELLDCLSAKGPEISFSPGEAAAAAFDPAELADPVDVDPMGLLMEAARREDEIERIKDRLPNIADIAVPLPAIDPAPGLESELVKLCDGQRTVEEICLEARATRNQTLTTLVDMLDKRKIVMLGPKELLEVFVRSERAGHYTKALKVFERLESLVSVGPECAEMAARSCELSGKSKEAARRYRDLAKVKQKHREPNRAVAYLERAILLEPDNMGAHRELALLFHSLRQAENISKCLWRMVKAAEENAAKAELRWALDYLIKLDANDDRPYIKLAEFCAESGELHTAVSLLETLAEKHSNARRYDKAVEIYTKILDVDNKHVNARLQRASLLTQIGELDRAIDDYKRLEVDLKDTGVIGVSGDELTQMYSRLLKSQPNNAAVRDLLIDAQIEDKNPVAAWETLKPALDHTETAIQDGCFERLKKLFQSLPGDEVIGRALARVAGWRGDREFQSRVLRQLAQRSIERNRLSGAEAFLLELLKDQPFDLEAHKSLAEIHERRGDASLAAQKRLDLACICSRVGRFEEARWHIEAARSLDPFLPQLRDEERELRRRAGG